MRLFQPLPRRLRRTVSPGVITPSLLVVAFLLVCCICLTWPGQAGQHAPVYFLSIGDFGVGTDRQALVARQMASQASARKASFVLSLGDNVYDAGVSDTADPRFRTVFEDIYTDAPLQVPWYMCLGDHDHRGNVSAQIAYSSSSAKWNMSGRYYVLSVPLGGRHTMDVVITDSVALEGAATEEAKSEAGETDRRFAAEYNLTLVGHEAGREHLLWLEDVLHNSTADWLVVVGHRPVLSSAKRPRFPAEARYTLLLQPLLIKYNVDLYISGHDHVGQHLEADGVVYIGNGVGGYGNHPASPTNHTVWVNDNYCGFILHKVTPAEMELTFVASNGTALHHIQLQQSWAQKDMRR